MLFLFNAIVAGALITCLTSFKPFRNVQQTVALFLLGVTYSLILEGTGLHSELGILGRSFKMWMDIDPHLLLFTMLPALLTADAMNIDTSVAKRVMGQCIWLAGPIVLFNTGLIGLFLWAYLPYDWSFLLSLTTGSILCATDPVAVVALLKELGASPSLTVQIQGESLLNDGTAIVLFTIAYSMLQDKEYEASDVVIYLLKTALCAMALGMGIGLLFYAWIKACGNKWDHSSALVQTVLTLSCAYWSFVVAEGVFQMSGVLSCVAASLVLAHKMWPAIVDKESLEAFWHTFEYIGNSVVFFLAGSLAGTSMVHIPVQDYVHLIVIYIITMIIRAAGLFISKPVLKRLSPDCQPSWRDLLVMTWGGLRGAVGVALAIQVAIGKADGRIGDRDADRVLFYVCGIASLTLVINASTCPGLVRALGITCWPEAKCEFLMMLHAELQKKAQYRPHTPSVSRTLNSVLQDVEHHIKHQAKKSVPKGTATARNVRISMQQLKEEEDGQRASTSLGPRASMAKMGQRASMRAVDQINSVLAPLNQHELEPGHSLVEEHKTSKASLTAVKWLQAADKHFTVILKQFPEVPFKDQEGVIRNLTASETPELGLTRMFNETFLQLIRAQYWHQIEVGQLPGLRDAETLLLGLTLAQSQPQYDLTEFTVLMRLLDQQKQAHGIGTGSATAKSMRAPTEYSRLSRLLNSIVFNAFMMVSILGSVIVTNIEDGTQFVESERAFFILECTFLAVFFVEFVLKFADRRLKYFRSGENVFELFLIVAGTVGIVITVLSENGTLSGSGASDESGSLSSQGRLFKFIRLVKILRLVRILRLYRLYLAIRAVLHQQSLSLELHEHLHVIAVLTGYVRAHVGAQKDLVRFFCSDGKIKHVNVARTLLQSQIHVYKAITAAIRAEQSLDKASMRQVMALRESMDIMMDMTSFVVGCHKAGLLDGRDTAALLHPMHDHMAKFESSISLAYDGFTKELDNAKDFTKGSGNGAMSKLKRGASRALFGSKESFEDIIPDGSPTAPSPSGRTSSFAGKRASQMAKAYGTLTRKMTQAMCTLNESEEDDAEYERMMKALAFPLSGEDCAVARPYADRWLATTRGRGASNPTSEAAADCCDTTVVTQSAVHAFRDSSASTACEDGSSAPDLPGFLP